MNIQDFLILEKRIAQISSNIDITFAFDVIKTTHAEVRSDFSKRGLGGDYRHISNSEMSEFVNLFKRAISENIVSGHILDQSEFVIRSKEYSLAMAIVAEEVSFTYWKLIIKTVFRESEEHQFKVGKNQLIFEI